MTYPDRSSHVRHGGEQVVVLPEDLPDLLLLFGGVIALRCNGGREKSLQIADPLARLRSAFTRQHGRGGGKEREMNSRSVDRGLSTNDVCNGECRESPKQVKENMGQQSQHFVDIICAWSLMDGQSGKSSMKS